MGSWVGGQKGSGHKECPLLFPDLRKGETRADLLQGPQLGPRTLGANVLYHVTLPHFPSHSLLVHIRAHDLMGDGGKRLALRDEILPEPCSRGFLATDVQ